MIIINICSYFGMMSLYKSFVLNKWVLFIDDFSRALHFRFYFNFMLLFWYFFTLDLWSRTTGSSAWAYWRIGESFLPISSSLSCLSSHCRRFTHWDKLPCGVSFIFHELPSRLLPHVWFIIVLVIVAPYVFVGLSPSVFSPLSMFY